MRTCWSCGKAPGPGAFCDACGSIQPETTADHFAVLGLPVRFAQDDKDLEQRYRNLQRKLHPDRFATRSAEERRMSLARATTANAAYRTLRDPVRRAAYLLELSGRKIADHGNGPSSGADPAFLMEMMEMRETLEEARTRHDTVRIEELASSVRGRRDAAMVEIASAFERARPEDVEPLLGRLRYYTRLLDEVAAFEEAS
jgi:molecular chaperone HscB